MTPTPTPRTDAMMFQGEFVQADFARQLERENQTFRAAQKACEDCDAPRVDRIAELEHELADSEKVANTLAEANGKLIAEKLELERELDQVKAILADPLAVHLNMMRGLIQWTPANLRHLLGDSHHETT